MKVFLVRHGESRGNVNQMEYFRVEDSKISLTEKGKSQSLRAGIELVKNIKRDENVVLVNSPYLRTQQTADEIARVFDRVSLNFRRDENPLLYERSWGALRDLVKNKKHTSNDFSFFSRPANGESFADVYTRVVLFFTYYIHTNEVHNNIDTFVVVTHGEWIKVANMFLMSSNVKEFEADRSAPHNCSISLYET
jgi:broad specificity phosphatase PhoE